MLAISILELSVGHFPTKSINGVSERLPKPCWHLSAVNFALLTDRNSRGSLLESKD